MPPTLNEILNTIRANLQAAKNRVGTSQGPLQNPAQSNLDQDLKGVQTTITSAFDIMGDVGELDSTQLPDNLPDIAEECVVLADPTVVWSEEPDPDYELIGNNLLRINWMIDTEDGYRDLAGIT